MFEQTPIIHETDSYHYIDNRNFCNIFGNISNLNQKNTFLKIYKKRPYSRFNYREYLKHADFNQKQLLGELNYISNHLQNRLECLDLVGLISYSKYINNQPNYEVARGLLMTTCLILSALEDIKSSNQLSTIYHKTLLSVDYMDVAYSLSRITEAEAQMSYDNYLNNRFDFQKFAFDNIDLNAHHIAYLSFDFI